jgi:hypothetical protein
LVKEYAEGIGLKNLAPMTYGERARIYAASQGEQIQMLLGHTSTEEYYGMQQNLVEAVNDKLWIVDANE